MDFALNDEQLAYKEKCRTFAREVIRPVARKHDRDEIIPWDVIKDARKQGFGGLEGIQRPAGETDGQMQVIAADEFHWGCAGTALGISGSASPPPVSPPRGPRSRSGVGPECFGDDETSSSAPTRHRAAGRLRRQVPQDHRQARWRRMGPRRDQGLHHQRRHRRRPRRGRPSTRAGPRAQASFVIGKAPSASPGQEGVQARDSRLAHGRGGPRGLPDPDREPARREEKLEKKLERGRDGK